MRKYGDSKTTRVMMATVPHVASGSGIRKFQADGFLFDRVYLTTPPIVSSMGLEAACREFGCYFNVTACLGMVQIATTLFTSCRPMFALFMPTCRR